MATRLDERSFRRTIGAAIFTAAVLAVLLIGAAAAPPVHAAPTPGDHVYGDETLTLVVTGDMLIHPRVSQMAQQYAASSDTRFDFKPMFDLVRPLIAEADLAICHQEVQLGVPGVEVSAFPQIAAPAEFGTAIADAGYDECSTASNHATDHGDPGLVATIDTLDAAGIAHTGTAATPSDADGVLHDLDDLTIGHVSYTYGIQAHRPAHPWSVNLIDPDEILADTASLEARGADFVIVSLHWGQQYRVAPTDAQRQLAERLTASGTVDLIVGHHAHVLQPIEHVNGVPVIFGLGNFLSNQAPSCCGVASGDGAAVLLKLQTVDGAWRSTAMHYVPTWVYRKGGGYVIIPTVDPSDVGSLGSTLATSRERAQTQMTFDGLQRPGLTIEAGMRWLNGSRPAPSDPGSGWTRHCRPH